METIIKRKRGMVVRLVVEIDASQASHFETVTKGLGLTKAQAVQQAINIWLSMVAKKDA